MCCYMKRHHLLCLMWMCGFLAAQGLKIVTFGDSTMENDGCSSRLLGVTFPPSPPYSDQIKYSSKLHWVDYFEQMYKDDIDYIIPCACGGSLASKTAKFDPLASGSPADIPGLADQVQICIQEKGLAKIAQEDTVIALIQSGGNDILTLAFDPLNEPATPKQLREAFETALADLAAVGVHRIFVGTTLCGTDTPRQRYNEANLGPFYDFLAQQGDALYAAYEEAVNQTIQEGLPVENVLLDNFLDAIREEAFAQGLNGVDSCIDPGSSWFALEFLPDCTEYNKRMWFDSVHLADWGHFQYAKQMGKYLESKGVLSPAKNNANLMTSPIAEFDDLM
eukprot:TRINITY_DN4411_c0_g1_i4.p1 TRINITY_DN4411_c0_g1~~TRINITY_DN4411_c0_g1_i4.p1  ORF type:complete len:335 (-),score=40.87 TRINITY_DN4411_c0_g1_i4:201-1205(-)